MAPLVQEIAKVGIVETLSRGNEWRKRRIQVLTGVAQARPLVRQRAVPEWELFVNKSLRKINELVGFPPITHTITQPTVHTEFSYRT